jgi:hypothetical protein
MDPWIAMANQLVPDYDELCKILEMKPEIVGKVTGRKLNISVSYPAQDEDNIYIADDQSELSKCIEWCTTELSNWPKCRRLAWDQWVFDKAVDAKKFLTLLNLKWK